MLPPSPHPTPAIFAACWVQWVPGMVQEHRTGPCLDPSALLQLLPSAQDPGAPGERSGGSHLAPGFAAATASHRGREQALWSSGVSS